MRKYLDWQQHFQDKKMHETRVQRVLIARDTDEIMAKTDKQVKRATMKSMRATWQQDVKPHADVLHLNDK
jgi:hypothetical protein